MMNKNIINKKLWCPIKIGNIELKNRLAMAPLTRSRNHADGTMGDFASIYYSQRASMGLIISEGTQPSLVGQGYLNSPGIYNRAQVESWKPVIEGVHALGGHMFIQLMHVGRMVNPLNTIDGHIGLAPSAIAPKDITMHTVQGEMNLPIPKAMNRAEINVAINDFAHSSKMAILAGADGVEIHGANGYLIHQFLGKNSNHRTDEYGGSIENRARFALEVTKAASDVIGSKRVGIRLSPYALFTSVDEGQDAKNLYIYLAKKLNTMNLAYVHVINYGSKIDREITEAIRKNYHGTLIINDAGRPLDKLTYPLENDLADIVSVGHWAISNPDLVYRLQNNIPLNDVKRHTLYGGGDVGHLNMPTHGYIDYPTIETEI